MGNYAVFYIIYNVDDKGLEPHEKHIVALSHIMHP